MEKAQIEKDLPDFLVRDISAILQRQKDFEGRENELDDLIEMVTMYDTYGQTGYLGMGVNNVILQKALAKLLRPEQEICTSKTICFDACPIRPNNRKGLTPIVRLHAAKECLAE